MPRYIDADKTLDLMWNALYKYEDEDEKKNGLGIIRRSDVQNGFEIAHKVVVDAPTEDVAPVVHAHWVEFENPNYSHFDNSPEKIVLCSHCNNGHGTKDDYCCVCGAKMDEEV